MEPIITSNPYTQTVNEFFKLYWEESFRKYWFLFTLLTAAFFWQSVYTSMRDGIQYGLINLGIFVLVILFIRYRFISTLRRNPAFESPRVLTVYANRLEVEDTSGAKGVFHFTDIASVKALKNDYRIRLHNKQIFWIPMDCFKSEADLDEFEEILRGE